METKLSRNLKKDHLNLDGSNPMKCEGFVAEQIDDEVVLLHPKKNIILHTNQITVLIWQLCDGSHSIDEIVDIFKEIFPHSGDEIALEVPKTIQQLRTQGALTGR